MPLKHVRVQRGQSGVIKKYARHYNTPNLWGSLCQSLDKFGNQELSHLTVITEIENLFHILHKYVVG